MLEGRKQDHIHWVEELKKCVDNDEPFGLATDPHKCAFGKWYDAYKPENQTIAFHLKKIQEPHEKLHITAHEAFACKRIHDTCNREECLMVTVRKCSETYMNTVVELLEDAKTVFRESYRKMCVVISQGRSLLSVLVDEVISVEQLKSIMEEQGICGSNGESLISYIAQRHTDTRQTLVIDIDALFLLKS